MTTQILKRLIASFLAFAIAAGVSTGVTIALHNSASGCFFLVCAYMFTIIAAGHSPLIAYYAIKAIEERL